MAGLSPWYLSFVLQQGCDCNAFQLSGFSSEEILVLFTYVISLFLKLSIELDMDWTIIVFMLFSHLVCGYPERLYGSFL